MGCDENLKKLIKIIVNISSLGSADKDNHEKLMYSAADQP